MHHVKTQAPYALLVGLSALFFGDLLSGYLYPMWAGALTGSYECFCEIFRARFVCGRVACPLIASPPSSSASCQPFHPICASARLRAPQPCKQCLSILAAQTQHAC